MNALDFGGEALALLTSRFPIQTVLDIGAGVGAHATYLRERGFDVTTISWTDAPGFKNDVLGDYNAVDFGEPFDAIWASHVLEHQPNPGAFLRKIHQDLKPGGVIAISVPPAKPNIVGGHLTIWNAGLLLYNLIMAGFDCREASVKSYGYNISIVTRKRLAQLPDDLVMDRGDIERLSRFFPFPAKQDFDGNIVELNWDTRAADRRPIAGSIFNYSNINIDMMKNVPTCFNSDLELLLWAMECREIVGYVLNFGFFEGRSIKALATFDPNQPITGFESFATRPEPWVRSGSSTYNRGHFAFQGLPEVPSNVRLISGLSSQSLASWLSDSAGPISLLHLDGDLYSSAIERLEALNARIVRGTVIVFDKLCDWRDSGIYPNWAEHERRALLEWMERFSREIRLLGRGPMFNAAFVVES